MDFQAKIDELKLQDTPESNFQLGKLYATGPVGIRNYDEAVKYYEKAADAGLSEAQYQLGWMYIGYLGIKQNSQLALKYLNAAAEQNHGSACAALGTLFAEGTLVPTDQDKAEQLFNKAKLLLEMDMQKGNADAIAVLGYMYQNGYGVHRDFAKAKELYEQAVALKNSEAMFELGIMYYQGQCGSQDFAKAKELFEQAVALDNADAMTSLGNLYIKGQGVPQDFAKAKELFEQAIALGESDAMTNLGFFYQKGQDVPQDLAKAKELFEQAIALGNHSAINNLGMMYKNGQGVPQDFAKAKDLFEQAASLGDSDAISNIGNLYLKGQGVTQDFAKAKKLYEQAVALGNVPAMTNLGFLYKNGQGVPQNFAKAKELFEQATALGNESAMSNLGMMYKEGQGVPQNFAKAKELFEQAMALGNTSSMFNLAFMYQYGEGMPKDYAKARDLHAKCYASGDQKVIAELDALYSCGQGVPDIYEEKVENFTAVDKSPSPAAKLELFQATIEELNTPSYRDVLLDTPKLQSIPIFTSAVGVNNFTQGQYGEAFSRLSSSTYQAAPEIHFALGVMYDQGLGTQPNQSKAQSHLTIAADSNYADALHYLAFKACLAHDSAAALAWFKQAANSNDPLGLCEVGIAHWCGIGSELDYSQAQSCLKKAAAQSSQANKTTSQANSALASFLLGQMYLNEYAGASQADSSIAVGNLSMALSALTDNPAPTPAYLDGLAISKLDALTIEAWQAYALMLELQKSTSLAINSESSLSQLKQRCELNLSKLSKQTESNPTETNPTKIEPENKVTEPSHTETDASSESERSEHSEHSEQTETADPLQPTPAEYEHCSYLVDYLLGQLYLRQDSTQQAGVDMLAQLAVSTSLPPHAAYLQAAAAFKLGLHYEALAGQSEQFGHSDHAGSPNQYANHPANQFGSSGKSGSSDNTGKTGQSDQSGKSGQSGCSGQSVGDNSNLEQALTFFKLAAITATATTSAATSAAAAAISIAASTATATPASISASTSAAASVSVTTASTTSAESADSAYASSFDFRSLYRLKALLKLCKYYSDNNLSAVTPESLSFYQQAAAEGLAVVGRALGNWYQSHGEIAQAVAAYDLAAQAGNAQAQLLLGRIYYSEPNFLNQAKAQELFESALALGQTEAALPLAKILEQEQEQDRQGQGGGGATSGTTSQDAALARIFELYFQAAQTGDAEAQFRVGRCYLYGHGTEASAQKALSWLEKAAAQQHPQALFTLAQMYELGQDVTLNQAKAHDLYQQAASLGCEDAANVLAKQQLLSGGQGNTQELLQQLKNSGDQTTVLNFYLELLSKLTAGNAEGADSESAQAAEQRAEVERALLGLKELADDGLLDAQIAVAQFYECGLWGGGAGAAGNSGESADVQAQAEAEAKSEAQIYHTMAAEQGYIPSFVALADYAWHNNDYAGAFEWSTKLVDASKKAVNKLPQGYVVQVPENAKASAANTSTSSTSSTSTSIANSTDNGFKVRVFTGDDLHAALAQASWVLGCCYEKGLGVAIDCKKAADWYSKASELGQSEARLALALLYLNGGQGFKANERQAITLLSKLAKRKVAAGQYELGKAYLAGQGVKADPKQAFPLIKAAAEQKHLAAMALLSELYAKGTGTAANPKQAQSWLNKAKAAGWKA